MSVVIRFERAEDHERAIGVLSDSDEIYHGVAASTIAVTRRAFHELKEKGVHFQVLGDGDGGNSNAQST